MAQQTENTRYARVLDYDYRFDRIEPQLEGRTKKVVACWESYLEAGEKASRAILNEYADGTYEAWSMPGIYSHFPGAAAIEVIIRSLQREHFHAQTKADNTRRLLTNKVIPAVAVVGVLVGYIFGALR